jgi:hypothetical protein
VTELEEIALRETVEDLRMQVDALVNVSKHQAALLIVLYNGLDSASSLILRVTRATSLATSQEDRKALFPQIQAEVSDLGAILTDIHKRLEPMRVFLSD